jgi:hypothetical protein
MGKNKQQIYLLNEIKIPYLRVIIPSDEETFGAQGSVENFDLI